YGGLALADLALVGEADLLDDAGVAGQVDHTAAGLLVEVGAQLGREALVVAELDLDVPHLELAFHHADHDGRELAFAGGYLDGVAVGAEVHTALTQELVAFVALGQVVFPFALVGAWLVRAGLVAGVGGLAEQLDGGLALAQLALVLEADFLGHPRLARQVDLPRGLTLLEFRAVAGRVG